MRTLSLLVLMIISLMVTPLFAEEDDAVLVAEKTLQAVNEWLEDSPDFSKNFFVDSLEQLEHLEKALQALEKSLSEKAVPEGKVLRVKMLVMVSFVLKTGFFKVSPEEEKALESLTERPLAELVSAYKSKLESCQLEAVQSIENAPKLVARFQETELWLRLELFNNAEALIQKLYQARLASPNNKLVDYMRRIADAVSNRTGTTINWLDLATEEPKEVFYTAKGGVRFAKERFGAFNAAISDAQQFLATEFLEKEATVALEAAKILFEKHERSSLSGELRNARLVSLFYKMMVKVLTLHKLNPELYLCNTKRDRALLFAEACVQILEGIASGKREPDWTKPTLALDELEKAYRWYEPHREMQMYISEVMIEVQKLVHDTGSTALKGKLLREVVMVIHGLQEEIALK